MTTNNRLLPNGLDIESVSPRRGAKYSPNLYRWLTSPSNKHRPQTSRIYRDAAGDLWIGMLDMGDLIGSRLIAVLCNGTKERTFCYPGLKGLQEVADFWPRYTQVGRCAIDPGHNASFLDNRWTVTGDTRNCLWCGGATQYLHRWTEPVQRGAWLTEPARKEQA
jgi:hypothetical protein